MTETKPASQLATTDKQADLIKSVFKENEFLLKAMRNLFFGLTMTQTETDIIKSTFGSNPELRSIVRKKIYPIFSEDTLDLPTGLVADFWLDIDKDLLGASRDAIYQKVHSKQRVSEMLSDAIALLENPDGKKINLSYNPNTIIDELQVSLLARALYIRTIGQGLFILKTIADQKVETPTAIQEKAKKNSTK